VRYSWQEDEQVYVDEEGHKLRDTALTALLLLLIGKVSRRLARIEDARRSMSRIEEGPAHTEDDRRPLPTHIAEERPAAALTQAAAQTETQRELTLAHRMMAALAVGGLRQITTPEQVRTDDRIREQKTFLIRFYLQGPFISDAEAAARISQYAGATYGTFEALSRASHQEAGYTHAEWILDAGAEHCHDCPEQAARGRQPIDSFPEIGSLACLSNCRCNLQYFTDREAEAAA
jgi:hypothetical protein